MYVIATIRLNPFQLVAFSSHSFSIPAPFVMQKTLSTTSLPFFVVQICYLSPNIHSRIYSQPWILPHPHSLLNLSHLIDYKYQFSMSYLCFDRHAAKTWDTFFNSPNILSTPFLLDHATVALHSCCLGLNFMEMELLCLPRCA